MKNILLISLSLFFFGCVSNVSDTPPHRNLVKTVWKLKTDAYVIEYQDSRGVFRLVPCVTYHSPYLPQSRWEYDEGSIGKKGDGSRIVAGVRRGEELEVTRVMKETNPEVGTWHIPIAVLTSENEWLENEELNIRLLYKGFDELGILNPEFAELVPAR